MTKIKKHFLLKKKNNLIIFLIHKIIDIWVKIRKGFIKDDLIVLLLLVVLRELRDKFLISNISNISNNHHLLLNPPDLKIFPGFLQLAFLLLDPVEHFDLGVNVPFEFPGLRNRELIDIDFDLFGSVVDVFDPRAHKPP